MARSMNTVAGVATLGLPGLLTAAAGASLIGINPATPQVFFDNQGTTTYDADTDLLSIQATPFLARFEPGAAPRVIAPTGKPGQRLLTIDIRIAPDGSLLGGVSGDDLLVIGEVDQDGDGTPDFDGVLLQGEIVQFGHFDSGAPFGLLGGVGTDVYDMRFSLSGGSMAVLYEDNDLGVVVTSDRSTFAGTFTIDFDGEAKGTLGAVGPPGEGACCFDNGSCEQLDLDECEAAGGIFQGDLTICEAVVCVPVKGACCFPDGSCGVVTQEQCASKSGLYQGDDTVCPEVDCPPPVGACCLGGGLCEELPQDDCLAAGGLFQGQMTGCDAVECPIEPQACCFDTGNCAVLPPGLCLSIGGDPLGPGTDCKPNRCPEPSGACCLVDGSCQLLTPSECIDLAGFFQGANSQCGGVDCVQPKGACCLPGGQCVVIEEGECLKNDGDYLGDNTICVGNPCG